jgi:hypothetical protein
MPSGMGIVPLFTSVSATSLTCHTDPFGNVADAVMLKPFPVVHESGESVYAMAIASVASRFNVNDENVNVNVPRDAIDMLGFS